MSRHEFWAIVIDLCLAWPCSLTSGPRTAKRNALPHVQGSPTSRHLTADAADLVPDEPDGPELEALGNAATRLGLRVLIEKSGDGPHVHASRPILEYVVEPRASGGV